MGGFERRAWRQLQLPHFSRAGHACSLAVLGCGYRGGGCLPAWWQSRRQPHVVRPSEKRTKQRAAEAAITVLSAIGVVTTSVATGLIEEHLFVREEAALFLVGLASLLGAGAGLVWL